jgi:hypothetical protein
MLSCRATRAGAAKSVRYANNVFDVLFLKIIFLKKVKLKNHSNLCPLLRYVLGPTKFPFRGTLGSTHGNNQPLTSFFPLISA